MRLLMFAHYYIKLRLNIILTFHRTNKPLTIWWRWKYWNHRQRFHKRLIKRIS